MNERLKQFLTMENLSPARFAEILGIQRSGISHLLAGRNKPSFEFIQRMMTAYPDLNYEWLILGKGRPYRNDRTRPENSENIDLFTESVPEDDPVPEELVPETQEIEPENPLSQPSENPIFDAPATATPSGRPKKIARIIVFFNDGTYEEK
ncbi:MAG: helix-turn-helix transcriptional regulator [Bacteroidales bacterium]|nr:helix-turn-helix transcriptional regulator [Bacteroidales bacterium]